MALGDGRGGLTAVGSGPHAESPYGEKTLRYVRAVPLPDGSLRVYFEAAAATGGNDLRTQLLDPAALRELVAGSAHDADRSRTIGRGRPVVDSR